jgi:hypothetical protein
MKLCLGLLVAVLCLVAAPKKKAAAPANCVDTPRVMARKKPVKKLEFSEAMRGKLTGVLFGVKLNEKLELNIDMQAPTEDGATQLEKMVSLLASAEQLKSEPGETVVIDLPQASKVTRSGKVVRTTVSLTDAQLERLLEARYGRKLVSEAKARMVFVHGLPGGTKSYPWGEQVIVDLRR